MAQDGGVVGGAPDIDFDDVGPFLQGLLQVDAAVGRGFQAAAVDGDEGFCAYHHLRLMEKPLV